MEPAPEPRPTDDFKAIKRANKTDAGAKVEDRAVSACARAGLWGCSPGGFSWGANDVGVRTVKVWPWSVPERPGRVLRPPQGVPPGGSPGSLVFSSTSLSTLLAELRKGCQDQGLDQMA